ncbi:MAG: hypothetical protein IT305_16685 [Chloroflexi bacterium]|nr:hypothetical protein [Chloroflexota bacterium]
MAVAKLAVDAITSFTGLAKQLAKLPELTLPQYAPATRALYEICQALLVANENTARWYYRFLYFDFHVPDARSKWIALVQEYRPWRAGPGYHDLKFRCSDIELIYYRDIESKFGSWLLDRVSFPRQPHLVDDAQARITTARAIVSNLATADGTMVTFITDEIFGRIDEFVKRADPAVLAARLDEAERHRLIFKSGSKTITLFLDREGGALTDLVIAFANAAKVPIGTNKTYVLASPT